MEKSKNIFADFKQNLPSGIVVFLVALPLCLGIALASGAPPLSGIIAGIIGGIVIGFMSNSQISVSGPAAGLAAIVLGAITELGSFELFLTAGLIADGTTIINNADYILRGYERIINKLSKVGANIKIVEI